MKSYKQLIEGVYDPNIFKAFFLAGGPGSGKSFVVRRATGGLGLKIVNSDTAFEKLLKDADFNMDFRDMNPEKTLERDVIRKKSKPFYRKKTKGIYGNATKNQIKELHDEGIETHSFPWIEDKKN